jgi:hypothetical protein
MAAAFWPGAPLPLPLSVTFTAGGAPTGAPQHGALVVRGQFPGLLLQGVSLAPVIGCRIVKFLKGAGERELIVVLERPAGVAADGAAAAARPQQQQQQQQPPPARDGEPAERKPAAGLCAAPLPEPSSPDDVSAASDGFTQALLAACPPDAALQSAVFKAVKAVMKGSPGRRADFVAVDYRMLRRVWAAGDAGAVGQLIRAFVEDELGPAGGGGGGGGAAACT